MEVYSLPSAIALKPAEEVLAVGMSTQLSVSYPEGTYDSYIFTYDEARNSFYATAGDQICYMGTYGSYVTFGCLQESKLADDNYFGRFYTID